MSDDGTNVSVQGAGAVSVNTLTDAVSATVDAASIITGTGGVYVTAVSGGTGGITRSTSSPPPPPPASP